MATENEPNYGLTPLRGARTASLLKKRAMAKTATIREAGETGVKPAFPAGFMAGEHSPACRRNSRRVMKRNESKRYAEHHYSSGA